MAGAKADIDAETADGGGGAGGAGGGGGGSFSEQRLVEKLNKLNNSAASIQSILFPWLLSCKLANLVVWVLLSVLGLSKARTYKLQCL